MYSFEENELDEQTHRYHEPGALNHSGLWQLIQGRGEEYGLAPDCGLSPECSGLRTDTGRGDPDWTTG